VQLSNSFEVDASPEATWARLNDVPRIVPCMPGSKLEQVVGPDEWAATLQVKLGPISLQFAVSVVREEADEAVRRVRLSAKAREQRGRGHAQASIVSSMTPSGAGTRVEIETDLVLRGAVAQYGRGIVPDVASRMTREFADCLARQLTESPEV
jgi:carbon monoxide dehydrogenase subunit G